METPTFYMLRNPKGEYYRSYSPRKGSGWTPDLEDAHVYTKLSKARAAVTREATENEVPELLVFRGALVEIIDQKARVMNARQSKEQRDAKHQADFRQMLVDQAQADFDAAKTKLERARGVPAVVLPPRRHDDDCGCKSCVGM